MDKNEDSNTLNTSYSLIKEQNILKKIHIFIDSLILIFLLVFGILAYIKVNEIQNSFDEFSNQIQKINVNEVNKSFDLIAENLETLDIESLNNSINNINEVSGDINNFNNNIEEKTNIIKDTTKKISKFLSNAVENIIDKNS